MKWTKNLPTVPGRYWWRITYPDPVGGQRSDIVQVGQTPTGQIFVTSQMGISPVGHFAANVLESGGAVEWSDVPIPEPDGVE